MTDDNSAHKAEAARMGLRRSESGVWTLEPDESGTPVRHPSYADALPRYLSSLDPLFERARAASEFNFLLSIFAVRGVQDPGWDPYETTKRAIEVVRTAANQVEGEAGRHLALWLYGHIVEASEPYEFVANLIDISGGGQFKIERFPPKRSGAPMSPSTKIERLESAARAAGLPAAAEPIREIWNRELRNAIFHADYTLHGPEVRTMRPTRRYTHDEAMTLINRAIAYHEALSILRQTHVSSYSEPTSIPADPEFTRNPGEMAVVIVREGLGATGIKDAWSREDLARGCIPYRLGRFSVEEAKLLQADRMLALLPARPGENKGE